MDTIISSLTYDYSILLLIESTQKYLSLELSSTEPTGNQKSL